MFRLIPRRRRKRSNRKLLFRILFLSPPLLPPPHHGSSVFTDPISLLWFWSASPEKFLLLTNMLVKYMMWNDTNTVNLKQCICWYNFALGLTVLTAFIFVVSSWSIFQYLPSFDKGFSGFAHLGSETYLVTSNNMAFCNV